MGSLILGTSDVEVKKKKKTLIDFFLCVLLSSDEEPVQFEYEQH